MLYRHNVDKELSDGEEEEEAFSAVKRPDINNNNNSTNNNNSSINTSGNSSKDYHGKQDKYNNKKTFNKQQQQQLHRTSSGGSSSNLANMGNLSFHSKQTRYQSQLMSSSGPHVKSGLERQSSMSGGTSSGQNTLPYTNRRI